MEIFQSQQYKRYRSAYITQCTIEHLLGLLVLDAFFAKLLSYIGLSDSMVGIISSFASLAFLFQLLSIRLVQTKLSTKKIVIVADVGSQAFFMLLYFIPFIPLPDSLKKGLVMAAVMIAQAAKACISSLYFKWANTYVAPDKRATFSAGKECISLLVGIVFSAGAGLIIDKYESIGNIKGGFLFIGLTMLVLNLANFISFVLIKDESADARNSMRIPTKEVLGHIRSNKIFARFIFTGFLFSFASGLSAGFIGIYKTKDLAFSVFTIQVINIAADFLRMGLSIPIANYSKKFGFIKGIQLSHLMNAAGYLLICFTSPTTRWLIIPYTLLAHVSQAASYQNSFNVYYTLLPTQYMTQAMAIRQTITGLTTFFASILGGYILEQIQAAQNTLWGISLYGQQFLCLLSLLLFIPAFFLETKYVVCPLLQKNRVEQ